MRTLIIALTLATIVRSEPGVVREMIKGATGQRDTFGNNYPTPYGVGGEDIVDSDSIGSVTGNLGRYNRHRSQREQEYFTSMGIMPMGNGFCTCPHQLVGMYSNSYNQPNYNGEYGMGSGINQHEYDTNGDYGHGNRRPSFDYPRYSDESDSYTNQRTYGSGRRQNGNLPSSSGVGEDFPFLSQRGSFGDDKDKKIDSTMTDDKNVDNLKDPEAEP